MSKENELKFAGISQVLVAGLIVSLAGSAGAQTSVPPDKGSLFLDTSMLKPPAGAKVAIVEWEDMACPDCAHAFPFVHAAMKHYNVPLVRYDFLIPRHVWSHRAALYARYLEDKVSPEVATQYRREVFASQPKIADNDALTRFTKEFFTAHGKELPAVLDPTGQQEREVNEGDVLGHRLSSRMHTPTIIVVTSTAWIEVVDEADLNAVIEQAEATVTAGKIGAPAGQ
jgi:protein-disulfide isomerase